MSRSSAEANCNRHLPKFLYGDYGTLSRPDPTEAVGSPVVQRACTLDEIAGKLSGNPRERMRAGRPRSRVGILHTLNREHPCHHARESGDAPGSALRNHSPLEGESARQGRMPAVEPVGGQRGVARVHSPQSSRWGVYSPSQCLSRGEKRGTAASWGTPRWPPTGSAFAIRLDLSDSPSRGE